MSRSVLGLDVGGANLKAAHSRGLVRLRPFELWKNPSGLVDALRDLFREMPTFDLLVVTMTGELCDCFATKREGVGVILDAVESVASGVPVRVWQTTGTSVDPAAARARPLETAAGNWLALATFAARFVPSGPGLVIDIGSTTADLIPLFDGKPIPRGRTDLERLRSGELVYTGVRRTPICALLGGLGAAELFATTLDVYLMLEMLPEDADDHQTADGRPATRKAAHARLARMLCADVETFSEEDARDLANDIHRRQISLLSDRLEEVIRRLPAAPSVVVTAGSGEFLARMLAKCLPRLAGARVLSLEQELGSAASAAACAYALVEIFS